MAVTTYPAYTKIFEQYYQTQIHKAWAAGAVNIMKGQLASEADPGFGTDTALEKARKVFAGQILNGGFPKLQLSEAVITNAAIFATLNSDDDKDPNPPHQDLETQLAYTIGTLYNPYAKIFMPLS